MSIRIVAGELRTGRLLTDLPATDATWTTVLNDAGDISATIGLRAGARGAGFDLAHLDPARCYLAAVTDSGDVLEAGPIWKHDFDDSTGKLTVGAGGLWSLFDHRKVLPVLAAGQTAQHAVLSWSGTSLGTIAKRLVDTAMAHVGGSLPVVLPADVAGVAERVYPGYELGWAGERLRQLAEVEDGPDLAFQPRLTTDQLGIQWVMRHGTPASPLLTQTGADWRWDRGVVAGPLVNLSVSKDATRMASRTWAVGSGMETELVLGTAQDLTLPAAGFPLLEAETSQTEVTLQATINGHAAALLGTSRRPWQTWKVTTRDDVPQLGLYRPGDWATVHVPAEHEYLAEGAYRTRILSVSGGLDRKVQVALAPTMEAR